MAGAAQCPNPTHLDVTQGVGVRAALCRAAVARDLAVHEPQEASLEVTARTLQGDNNNTGFRTSARAWNATCSRLSSCCTSVVMTDSHQLL